MLKKDNALTKEEVASLIHVSLRKKIDIIVKSVDGFLTPLQKQLLLQVIDHIDDMTRRIEKMDALMDQYLDDYHAAIEKLDEIPGVGRQSAETILAEIGLDMSRFPTEKHFASWAGLAPGNNESSKKCKSGRTTKGNITLKTTLIQCAKSCIKKIGSFLYLNCNNKLDIPIPPLEEQKRIVIILNYFNTLIDDISKGLPAEIAARQKQYKYYRDKLLTFKELS